jgi:hypothetical protein
METLARWESRGKRYWVEVRRNDDGSLNFRSDNSGGSGYPTVEDAIRRAELECTFQPSRMTRVK